MALTLKVVAGLSTAEVARVFLVPEADDEPAAAARQAQDRERRHPLPGARRATDLPERLDGVLAVVYLVFTQGYAGAAAPPSSPRRPSGSAGCWSS